MTPTIAIIPMNLTPSRSYLILIGFGNNIERTIDPLAVLNPVRTTIPFRDNQTGLSRALWSDDHFPLLSPGVRSRITFVLPYRT